MAPAPPEKTRPAEPAAPSQAPFQARRERPLDAKPQGLCAGDFDGDGRLDLAATLVSPGGLLVWRGGESGLEREFRRHSCGDFPLAPVALPRGSFAASSGVQPIAVCSRAARTLELVAATTRSIALEETPRALAAGKIGERAVVAVACAQRRLEVLRDGGATLEHWKLSSDLPCCAAINSELGAVIVGFQDSTTLEAYTSADGAPSGRITLGGIPRALAELDVDGDGDLELAVAGGDHELWLFGIGAGGGARAWFEDRPCATWRTDAIPLALAVADFDADGRSDLALLHHYQLTTTLMTQLSADGPGHRSRTYAGQTPTGIAVLDADGDSKLDVAVANRDTQGLGFLLGDGAGALGGAGVPLGDFPNSLAVAPESAGELRLVALNAKSNDVSAVVYANKALSAHAPVPCGSEARAPVIAELDDQAGLDLLFLATGARGAQVVRFSGDPSGRLEPASVLELGGAASDLALLDVDGDGKLELALCDPIAASVILLDASAAAGDAASLARAARAIVPASPRALCAIELDGDAPSELACVLGAPGERVGVAWLDARRNQGGHLELAEIGFCATPGAPIDAASCDLNGDGRMDLALLAAGAPGSSVGMWIALLRGPGGGADFSPGSPIPTGQRPHRIAARDLDGDGLAEVFVAAQDSHLINAWTSIAPRGAGAYEPRAWDDLGAGLGPLDLCLSDIDGDGLEDLCVVNGFSNDLSVLFGRRR